MEQEKRKELFIKMKKGLTTEKTFVVWIIGLLLGYMWATFKPDAPFEAFAYALTGGLLGIGTKRLFMKHNKFNDYEEELGIPED